MTQTLDIGHRPPEAPDSPAVVVSDLVKLYPDPSGGTFPAVDGVSLTVEHGEVFGVLGPNGAGKTTTLEILEGLSNPSGGAASVLGLDTVSDRSDLHTRIGVQLQASSYDEYLTLVELLELFGSFYPRSLPAEGLLERVGLAEKRKARIGQLSGGQAQRFSIVAALVNDPEVVFLDEPSTGLDPQARRNVWELIRSINEDDGKTVILTTHYMDEAEQLADRIAIMDRGRIRVIDTPPALIADHGGDPAVRFQTTVELSVEELAGLDGAVDAGRGGNGVPRYEIGTADPNLTVPALYAAASTGGWPVDDLRVVTPTLEDVFLNVTGHALRD